MTFTLCTIICRYIYTYIYALLIIYVLFTVYDICFWMFLEKVRKAIAECSLPLAAWQRGFEVTSTAA